MNNELNKTELSELASQQSKTLSANERTIQAALQAKIAGKTFDFQATEVLKIAYENLVVECWYKLRT